MQVILDNKVTISKLQSFIRHKGVDPGNGSKELTSVLLALRDVTVPSLLKSMDVESGFLQRFLLALNDPSESIVKSSRSNPYIISKYRKTFNDLKRATSQFINDGRSTRKAIIHFEPEHCFQTVQFVIRGDKLNVICTMRSCDAYKNLPWDIVLIGLMRERFLDGLGKFKTELSEAFDIDVFIGSLHVYVREDLEDVF